MNHQPLKIRNLADLCRFHRYVRSHRIRGTVRQNRFTAGAGNTFLLAFALPLEAATQETAVPVPAFTAK